MRPSNSPSARAAATILLATLLPTTLAQEDYFSFDTFRGGNAVQNIPFETWAGAFLQGNATSIGPISGYDVTKPYKTTPADWSFTIQVKDDIPYAEGDFVTGTWIFLNAPRGLVSKNDSARKDTTDVAYFIKQDKTWKLRASIWMLADLRSDAPIVNSNCQGFLSDACVTALNQEDRIPSSVPPNECLSEFGKSIEAHSNEMAENVPTTSGGKYNYAQNADTSTLHKPGNTTSYDVALRQVYVTSLKWASADTEPSRRSPTSVVCLRAGNNVEEGSRGIQPLPVDKSGTVARGQGSFWAMTALLGAVLVWTC